MYTILILAQIWIICGGIKVKTRYILYTVSSYRVTRFILLVSELSLSLSLPSFIALLHPTSNIPDPAHEVPDEVGHE